MTEQPNILFICTDQQRGDCLSVEGHPVLMTPNMDGIAAKGVRFSKFYSACPSCIAARRCMLSGQDPATHGMVGYSDGREWNPPATLPQMLKDNGYQTYLVGRSMHQHPPRKRFGYDDMEINCHMGASDYDDWLKKVGPEDNGGWFGGGVMHNDWTAHPWPLEEHLHFSNWTVNRALKFMERRDPLRPFFLTVSFIAPHPPLQPPAFYFDRYIRTGVPDPVIGDWEKAPEFGRGGRTVENTAPDTIDLKGEALLSTRAAYYGLINHVDDQIRRILNPITGIPRMTKNNTIVCFTSDHGEMLGDHYMWRKSRVYEPSARVPFLISAPDRFELRKTSVVDLPATHADMMPTLLEMAGIEIPDSVDGRSLLPLMRGESVPWREHLHIEHAPYDHALTDGREKYIWDPASGAEQMFDLRNDPNECHDLASDPAGAERVKPWREKMVRELKDRPEGFSDGTRLIAGRPYKPVLPHA